MQGMSAGVGTVVGRAIIRDCFEGAAATRLLALVSMIFSLSPALAPRAKTLLRIVDSCVQIRNLFE